MELDGTKNRGCIIVSMTQKYHLPPYTSIKKTAKKIISSMILNDSSLGTDFSLIYYGDELIWDTAQLLGLIFGDSYNPSSDKSKAFLSEDGLSWSEVTYEWNLPPFTLHEGWVYKYDAMNEKFYIYNENNICIYKSKTNELGMFRIDYSVFTSHQFYIYFDVTSRMRNWIINGQMRKNRENALCYDKLGIIIPDEFTNNEDEPIEAAVILPTSYVTLVLKNELSSALIGIEKSPTILRSSEVVRQRLGDYSNFCLTYDDREKKCMATKTRQAIIYVSYTMLWSAIYFNISQRGDATIDPWMLWEVWKWLNAGIPSIDDERIFDLSPNWSY